MRPLRRAAGILLDEAPLFQLDVYPSATILVRNTGLTWSTQLVDPSQAAELLSGVPTATGLLAPDILAAGRVHGKPFYVWLVRPRPATIGINFSGITQVTFRLPPMAWAGQEGDYRLVALHEADLDATGWPRRPDIPTYKAPFGNVFSTTGICWGSGERPKPVSPAGMAAAFEVFLTGSYFNSNEGRDRSKAYPANILLRYNDLGPETPYPCDDLIRDNRTLSWLLNGDPWRRA